MDNQKYEIQLRGQTIKIENVSDILTEELVQIIQTGVRGRSRRKQAAAIITEVAPSISTDLVSYEEIELDEGGTKINCHLGLDIHEIGAIVKAMTEAMLIQKRLRLTEQLDTASNDKKKEILQAIAQIDEGLPRLQNQLKHLELDSLLGSITVNTPQQLTEPEVQNQAETQEVVPEQVEQEVVPEQVEVVNIQSNNGSSDLVNIQQRLAQLEVRLDN